MSWNSDVLPIHQEEQEDHKRSTFTKKESAQAGREIQIEWEGGNYYVLFRKT